MCKFIFIFSAHFSLFPDFLTSSPIAIATYSHLQQKSEDLRRVAASFDFE
jgi:hypothetical protein